MSYFYDPKSRFKAGSDERARFPLSNGLYKLIECSQVAIRIVDTIGELQEAKRLGNPPSHLLGGAAPGTWIKRAFGTLGWNLGKNLPSSLERLDADGFPPSELGRWLPSQLQRCDHAVAVTVRAAEIFRATGIRREYERWEEGDSVLRVPCDLYTAVARDALATMQHHRPGRVPADIREDFGI